MAEYETKNYSLREDRFQAALSVLHTYCEIHENEPEYTDYVDEFLKKYEYHEQIKSGSNEYVREDVLQEILSDFCHLSKARMSVRDYSEEPVDDNLIYSALEIAQKTPSVCNRQTWRVHLIKDEKLLAEVLKLQGGLTGNGNNLKRLILVTTDLRYFSHGQERNQGYMDGGIYLMSLVYALTYKGLANCVLNADLALSQEIEMRKLLGLEDSEVMISFISVGNYPEKFKSPISPRDSYVESLIVH